MIIAAQIIHGTDLMNLSILSYMEVACAPAGRAVVTLALSRSVTYPVSVSSKPLQVTAGLKPSRQFAAAFRDLSGNRPESLHVYPNYEAPLVRLGDDSEREIVKLKGDADTSIPREGQSGPRYSYYSELEPPGG
ncbi:hypothetical protein [Mesorhizobium sp. Z1-4]|uniref:hypothetical protein n=1 Tax=Mesorhizobium sp. Z1-4 TaxID=2448478 RepID=UPI000FD7503C|nr:hypothetical protein [Mesorhizobium sp. Z1-4]